MQPLVQNHMRQNSAGRKTFDYLKAKHKNQESFYHQSIVCIPFYLTMILRAPRGVTRTAGAKAYAAKLAISPTTTVVKEVNAVSMNIKPSQILLSKVDNLSIRYNL